MEGDTLFEEIRKHLISRAKKRKTGMWSWGKLGDRRELYWLHL